MVDTTFSVLPDNDGGNPPESPDRIPQFLQFRQDDTDLGGPDADTLIFSTGLTATRGVGDHANEVTVESDGGGGATPTLVGSLTGSGTGQFNRAMFSSWSASTVLQSADVSMDGSGELTFNREGIYRVVVRGRVAAPSNAWPAELTNVGAQVDGDNRESQHARSQLGTWALRTGKEFLDFTDEFILEALVGDQNDIYLYGDSYNYGTTVATFSATVQVTWLGPLGS